MQKAHDKSEQLRIAVVYTGMPTSLVNDIESALKASFSGHDYVVMTYSDPSIIADAVRNGAPSLLAVKRLYNLYHIAMMQDADVIINACSSVGDCAAIAQPFYERLGIPLVRIDEKMARIAVKHKKIGVLATLSSTLEPTKRLLLQKAKETGTEVELTDILADGAFGQGTAMLTQSLMKHAQPHISQLDCILMAQGSMAPAQEEMQKLCGIPVYASPIYGADHAKEVLLENR